jgi:sulfatase modifying factor 1
MRRPPLTSRLVVFSLLALLFPCLGDVPGFSLVTVGHAGPEARSEAAEETSACDAIRAKIRKVNRQLRRAVASGKPTLVRGLRRQLRSLKRQLAICQATPPAPFIEMVTVGNPGNAADSTTYGAVAYEFKIGKFEVTLAQYAAFLNAVAATGDPFGLYVMSMATDPNIAGIARNGTSGNFSYSVIGAGTRPVTYVNWFDAARFCNWLHNGRPTGAQDATTTERGAYNLDGATEGGLAITRSPEARYWIPSEDEWYKAAYHDPENPDAGPEDYWLYPTRSNSVPGNSIGPLANQANYFDGAYSVTPESGALDLRNYLTEAGSFSGSASFYGTLDQGGNAFEWNDTVIVGTKRGFRGGSWYNEENYLRSSTRESIDPVTEWNLLGFRVAGP